MLSPLTLWHVNCGHSHENGCYGSESANNETTSGDSGSRRNHQSAATAPEAWFVPHSTSLACDPYHRCQAETDHRRRYARAAGYSASRKDHSFAPRSRARPGCTHNRHSHRDRGCSLVRIFYPFCSSRRKEAPNSVITADQDELEPPYVGCYNLFNFSRLIEDRIC